VIAAEPVSDVIPASTYEVKSGDNPWTIARKHNLTVAQLLAANNLKSDSKLQPGQKLKIPSRPTTPPSTGSKPSTKPADPSAPAAARNGESLRHVVKSGETLGAIARRYDVRQGDLAVLNNIADPAKIRPGMELVIPGYKSTASKSGKSTKSSGSATKAAAPAPSPAPATPAPAPTLPAAEPAPATPPAETPAPAPAVPVIKIN